MIYYFSGTGNSYWTAKKLGGMLNEPVESLVKYRQDPLVCKDAAVGFVAKRTWVTGALPTSVWRSWCNIPTRKSRSRI